MNGYEPSRLAQRGVSPFLVASLLVGVGILIGLVAASDLGWLPFGHAVPEPVKVKPTPASLPPPAVPAGPNFVEVAKAVTPAVVNIFTTRTSVGGNPHAMPFEDPFFRRFFGEEFFRRFEAPRERKERSLGSGVIVDPNGLILTNNHVVSKADEIKVYLADKREYKAKLVGTDSKSDLAVLKVAAEGLHTIPWADSDHLQVGEFVLAVGNPFGLHQTVTMGIVSAIGRASMGIAEYEDFIQTDAAINPGNSGGALVNARGELIGINTAIFSQSGGNMGIGFAVPSNMARSILEQLVKNGRVVRGWLGVSIQELTPDLASQFGVQDAKGVLVSDVLDDSPAKRAGIERGDIIVEFDGKPVDTPTQLKNVVAQAEIGRKTTVKLVRDRRVRTVQVTIAEQPKSVAQAGREDSGEAIRPAGLLSDLEVRELERGLTSRLSLAAGQRGVLIASVRPGSVAEETGLRPGDVLLEVNRKPVDSLTAYEREAAAVSKDPSVLLLIQRGGRTSYVTLKP
ncbi:DegQ family serine endoprotease [Nitrospira sp. Kam-Ns4a]